MLDDGAHWGKSFFPNNILFSVVSKLFVWRTRTDAQGNKKYANIMKISPQTKNR